MISYTWDDWDNMEKFLGSDFCPKIPQDMTSADAMIKYLLKMKYGLYGKKILDEHLYFMFNVPFDDVPLYVNTIVNLTPDAPNGICVSSIFISKAAAWRLQLGK